MNKYKKVSANCKPGDTINLDTIVEIVTGKGNTKYIRFYSSNYIETDFENRKINGFLQDITKDIEIKQGEEINLNSFVESCTDLSECSISSPDVSKLIEMQSKVGEYDLNIVGTDKYGNTVQKKVHLKVNEVPKVEVKKEVSSVGKGNGIAVLNYHFTISD